MLHQLILVCLFLSLNSCNPDKNTKVNTDNIRFNTNQASALFFKNIRQYYYDKVENPDLGLDIYTLKEQDSAAVILTSLILHWRRDKAYLMVGLPKTDGKIDLYWQSTNARGHDQYEIENIEGQAEFAAKVYNYILEEKKLFYAENGRMLALFPKAAYQEAFRISCLDFFRLTENLGR